MTSTTDGDQEHRFADLVARERQSLQVQLQATLGIVIFCRDQDILHRPNTRPENSSTIQSHPSPPQAPLIRLANWMSFCMIVTLFA